ncbi:phosphomannose isomerase type I [Colletotrichum abscissum]|uniref:Mannose-6-phosphate isomerase n=1 Tax=Colletotrichum abscissum TaxID=1671311 RepID=A0A9P9XMQ7_9PEZI|nr:phosphomannose isomerase type I [Colletotrichum abscissum]KAI3556137.1 phosphomannose isomerase type I [Colletotrichum abscissum]KAK1486868.1 phosphomannose isomerase type I [Colletotrichum abscissum]
MSSQSSVFQLSGTCNNYDWGKKGRDSLAARLCENTPGGFTINDNEAYSEMWFGDYPDFPARVLETGELLKDILDKNKEQLLGKKVITELDGQLPYLPKILSIAKALPLQIHPNKSLASKLHEQDPENFTDANHKPEIAVALGPFEVFAGFKPLDQISPVFNIPALRDLIPDGTTRWTDETLREVTRRILLADENTVEKASKALGGTPREELGGNGYVLDLLPRLQDQFGKGDNGILVALLCMNFLSLEAGDALYIPADGIHAYLSGDIVECMARSNNVLNTGFCPPGDRNNIDLFSKTLTFKAHSKNDVLLPAEKSSRGTQGRTVVYPPPLSEFDMLKTDLDEGSKTEVLKAGEGPSVAIVTDGEGVLEADGKKFDVKAGHIYFVAPGIEAKWETKGKMQVFTTVV